MKVGQEVSYIEPDGSRHVATVTEITGAGPSTAKTLNLSYKADGEDRTAEDVPHEGDAEQGQGFWLFKGERRERNPEDEAKPEAAPEEPDTVAFPDLPRASPRRRNK